MNLFCLVIVLIFSTEVGVLYELGLRTMLAPLFLALFSPFSELVTSTLSLAVKSDILVWIIHHWSCCAVSSPFLFLNWELVHSKLKTWICTYISVGFLISSTLFEFRMVLHWWLCSLSTAPDNALWVFLYEGCFIFDCFSCWVITINNSDSWISCQIPNALVLPRRKCQKSVWSVMILRNV